VLEILEPHVDRVRAVPEHWQTGYRDSRRENQREVRGGVEEFI
jgi:hypothetical protein